MSKNPQKVLRELTKEECEKVSGGSRGMINLPYYPRKGRPVIIRL